MSSNTELGRAVQDACEELDNLSNLVGQATYQAMQEAVSEGCSLDCLATAASSALLSLLSDCCCCYRKRNHCQKQVNSCKSLDTKAIYSRGHHRLILMNSPARIEAAASSAARTASLCLSLSKQPAVLIAYSRL